MSTPADREIQSLRRRIERLEKAAARQPVRLPIPSASILDLLADATWTDSVNRTSGTNLAIDPSYRYAIVSACGNPGLTASALTEPYRSVAPTEVTKYTYITQGTGGAGGSGWAILALHKLASADPPYYYSVTTTTSPGPSHYTTVTITDGIGTTMWSARAENGWSGSGLNAGLGGYGLEITTDIHGITGVWKSVKGQDGIAGGLWCRTFSATPGASDYWSTAPAYCHYEQINPDYAAAFRYGDNYPTNNPSAQRFGAACLTFSAGI